jgi:hypothetical protein
MPEKEKGSSASGKDNAEISPELVTGLGAKLDEFARSLNDDEHTTIATALALARCGLATISGRVACIGALAIRLGQSSISVARQAGTSIPRLSEGLESLYCPGRASRFSIEGLEVERQSGAKSVAAGFTGAKSTAAAFWNPVMAGAKSTAGSFSNPAFAGAKSTAAFCRTPFAGAKSTAAFCRTPFAGAKSTAAFCRDPGAFGNTYYR